MKTDLDLVPPELTELGEMSPEEQAYLRRALKDADSHRAALRELQDADFECQPVSIREFLSDSELLGNTGRIQNWDANDDEEEQGIYAFWRRQLDDLCNPQKKYSQWILSCAIGCGKSFIAIVALLYRAYTLLCLRNPQQFLGLSPNTPIVFSFFSATREIGKATEFNMLTAIMSDSPFFRKAVGVTDIHRPFEVLKLPKGLRISFGSRGVHGLGQNIYAALLDEAAFGLLTQDRQMHEVFDSIWRRLSSRYANAIQPGLLIMASSKAGEVDFLEKHIQRWATAENSDSVKVTRAALYDVKPNQFRAADNFSVMIGNETMPSRILEKNELPAPGFAVETIPNHPVLRAQFAADLEGALRDISSIVVSNANPLIAMREKIQACIDPSRQHPFKSQTVYAGTRDEVQIEHSFDYQQVLIRKASGWVPRINPSHSRYIGVDIGLRHDATGIAMCHLAGSRPSQALNELGEFVMEDMPIVFVDLVLQVRCKPGDQINLTAIAKFILFLARFCGYPIGGVSFDQFQSAHLSQMLSKLSFPVSYVSTDRSEVPYLTLSSLIQNESVSYYSYPPLLKELRELRRDLERRRVDHPYPDGSKDVSDALAFAVTSALKDKHSYAQGDEMPLTDRDFALRGDASRHDPNDLSWVTGTSRRVKVLNQPEFVVRDIFGNPAVK